MDSFLFNNSANGLWSIRTNQDQRRHLEIYLKHIWEQCNKARNCKLYYWYMYAESKELDQSQISLKFSVLCKAVKYDIENSKDCYQSA